jgi:outer membrane protein TolC
MALLLALASTPVPAATLAPEDDPEEPLVVSMTLEQFEARAIEKGVAAQRTASNLEKAGYDRQIAFRATDAPTATASYDDTQVKHTTNGVSQTTKDHDATVTVSEPTPWGTDLGAKVMQGTTHKPYYELSATQPIYLFVWNPRLRARRQAELNFADAKDLFQSEVLRLRAEARSTYYTVIQDQELVKVEERRVTSSRKLLDVTKALVDAGRSAPVETMRAKLRTQSAERQLENARLTLAKAIMAAKELIVYPLDQPLEFGSALQFKPLRPPLTRLTDYSLLHRPGLRTVRRSLESAILDAQAARETTRPTLAAGTVYAHNNLPGLETSDWTVRWGANWTFFDSFVTSKRVRKAEIDRYVATLNVSEAERGTRVDVQNAYLDVKLAEKQIQEFRLLREQAVRNVEVLRLRFQNGLERIIDVFDAETELRNQDNEYLGLLVQFNRSKDELSKLMGADVETIR